MHWVRHGDTEIFKGLNLPGKMESQFSCILIHTASWEWTPKWARTYQCVVQESLSGLVCAETRSGTNWAVQMPKFLSWRYCFIQEYGQKLLSSLINRWLLFCIQMVFLCICTLSVVALVLCLGCYASEYTEQSLSSSWVCPCSVLSFKNEKHSVNSE